MSKNKGKKKKEEAPVIQNYHPDELVNSLDIKFKEEEKGIEDLIDKLTEKNREYEIQAKNIKKKLNQFQKFWKKIQKQMNF
jgi:dsDNA-specific endonuclease/ATPase MutS2